MSHQIPPFAFTYSTDLPALLRQLHCTIAISAFQKGKLIFLAAKNDKELVQLPRNFAKPMGIALSGNKMALACKEEVIVFANSPELAASYPKQSAQYDALFMPRLTYHTGKLDLHDLAFGDDGKLYGVNTAYSCLVELNGEFGFSPIWQPPFISQLAKEDRCHLNGMCLENGAPRYVTALSNTNTPQGWRAKLPQNGILMDVRTNAVLAEGLAMPHSPRLHQNDLYFLCSATGELVKYELAEGKMTTVAVLNGFIRGLDFSGDYAFVGMSRLRASSSTAIKLKHIHPDSMVGVAVLHLPTGKLVGEISYLNTLDEIYEVKIFPNCHKPGILNTEKPAYKAGITWPDGAAWQS